jgi:hypothetical protein
MYKHLFYDELAQADEVSSASRHGCGMTDSVTKMKHD